MRWGRKSNFSHTYNHLYEHHLLNRPCFLSWSSVIFLSYVKLPDMYRSVSGLSHPFHWFSHLSLLQYYLVLSNIAYSKTWYIVEWLPSSSHISNSFFVLLIRILELTSRSKARQIHWDSVWNCIEFIVFFFSNCRKNGSDCTLFSTYPSRNNFASCIQRALHPVPGGRLPSVHQRRCAPLKRPMGTF